MPIVPLRDNVYIIPIEDPDQTESGLWIPEEGKQRTDHGIIKYRGDEVEELRVGDHVLFSGYAGTQIVTDTDGLLYVMRERSVLALFDDEEPLRFFTDETINRMVDKTAAKLITYDHDEDLVNAFADQFKSFLNDHFYTELQF